MKKVTIIIAILFIVATLISCKGKDVKTSSESQMISNNSNQTDGAYRDYNNSQVDVSYDFATESDAVEYYFDKIQAEQNSDSLQVQSNGQTGIYVYSLENIPSGYSFGKITGIGSYEYYNDTYRNADRKTDEVCGENAIYFRRYLNVAGEEQLAERIDFWTENGYGIYELNNKSGYFYVDCGYSNYIYWCEDGFCFLLQLPKSVGTVDPETHEYSGEDIFALKKTFYPFDDNTVAE